MVTTISTRLTKTALKRLKENKLRKSETYSDVIERIVPSKVNTNVE